MQRLRNITVLKSLVIALLDKHSVLSLVAGRGYQGLKSSSVGHMAASQFMLPPFPYCPLVMKDMHFGARYTGFLILSSPFLIVIIESNHYTSPCFGGEEGKIRVPSSLSYCEG